MLVQLRQRPALDQRLGHRFDIHLVLPRRHQPSQRARPRDDVPQPGQQRVSDGRRVVESGADMKRQNLPENLYTGIWWYARFPNHYSGDGSVATKELGDWNMKGWIDSIVECIRAVKADDASLKIQNEFYEKSKHPLDTRP